MPLPAGYSLDGEEVLAVSADNTEGDGLAVETPEPEPEPEEGAEGGALGLPRCLTGRLLLL